MVSGGPAGGRAEEVAIRLAIRLATRDERVLVVDTRIGLERAATEPAGLADLLGFHEAEWVPLLLPGPTAGVDLLPAGRAMDPDCLATQLMREFLESASRQYSFVILLAPGPEHANTLDILIPYTHGTLVCLGPGRPSPDAARAVSALRDRCGGRARAIIQEEKSTSA
jgi:Mrp family chromosome partitioning ATPase